MNMTIDEMIAQYKEKAKYNKMRADFSREESYCSEQKQLAEEHEQIAEWLEELKAYKEAEEQGLLLRLPCKVGDTVYFPIYEYHDSAIVETIRNEKNGIFFDWVQYEVGVDITECWDEDSFSIDEIGKTVFLTKEEAEQALKQMGE